MKRVYFSFLGLAALFANGQSSIDAIRLTQSDIKGTARFMSMGGAFGALGGDISVLGQNPGGIGVYRTQDISFTLDLDAQNSQVAAPMGQSMSMDQTKFLLNNIGAVFSINSQNYLFPNFNIGFSFNKNTSFNRTFGGSIPNLKNSMSNYVAGVSNRYQINDVLLNNTYNPYSGTDYPWISILGYDGYLTYPTGEEVIPEWIGQWTDGTTGFGKLGVETKGCVDEYNVALGGNIADVVFWGMDFGITSLSYTRNSYWGENLTNALIDKTFVDSDYDTGEEFAQGSADWTLNNYYKATGNGFNYKLGLIFKPIQELRIGVAFHTPTWYSVKEEFGASLTTRYGNEIRPATEYTNDGYDGYNEYNLRTPWRFLVSAAGVIGGRFIISADYEWTTYGNMKFSEYSDAFNYYDPYDFDYYYTRSGNSFSSMNINDPYWATNLRIQDNFKTMQTIRIGAEFRLTPQFSLRAGFAQSSSPVTSDARDNRQTIYTSGTMPDYTFDGTTTYLSGGLGYRYQSFYIDLAYQYKHLNTTYHAYTPAVDTPQAASPQADVKLNNNNVVMTMGFHF